MSDLRTKAITAFLAPGAFAMNRACDPDATLSERGAHCKLPGIVFLAAGISIFTWGAVGWAAWRLLRPKPR